MHTGENTNYSSWHESGPHLGRSKSLPWLLSRRVEGNVDLSVVRILVRDRTTNHCWYHTSPVSSARRGRQGNETGNGCLLSSSLGLMLNYLGTYHHQCVFVCMKKPNAACLINQCQHCLYALHKLIQITRNDFKYMRHGSAGACSELGFDLLDHWMWMQLFLGLCYPQPHDNNGYFN